MHHQDERHAQRISAITLPELPEDVIVVTGPADQQYLVPKFMLPALEQSFATHNSQQKLGVIHAPTGLLQVMDDKVYDYTGKAYVNIPPEPPLSEQELLALHANVLALQQRLGISYKDAAHQLYLSHLEKLKVSIAAFDAIKHIDDEFDSILRNFKDHLGDKGDAGSGTNN